MNLATDPHNCGACGHDCLGGACSASTCQPVKLATGSGPTALAVDANNVYWAGMDGSVQQVPTGGGAPTSLASGQPPQQGVPYLAIDATYVYWMENALITRVPIGGGTQKVLCNACGGGGLAIGPYGVYWGAGGPGVVPLTGGNPMSLAAPAVGGTSIVLGAEVYATAPGGVYEVQYAGSPAYQIVSVADPAGNIAANATSLFWSTGGSPATIESAPVAGGQPTTLASGFLYVAGLAIDTASVYFTSDGQVKRVALTGGTPEVLALNLVNPGPIAVDGKAVYWGNMGTKASAYADSSIMRLAK